MESYSLCGSMAWKTRKLPMTKLGDLRFWKYGIFVHIMFTERVSICSISYREERRLARPTNPDNWEGKF